MASLNVIKTKKKLPAVKVVKKIETSFNNLMLKKYYATAEELTKDLWSVFYFMFDDRVELKIDSKVFNFTVSGIPYCCGISEFGELSASRALNIDKASDVIDCIIERHKGHTFMVNTNGNASSRIWDAILTKSKYFNCVKAFKNANSGNTIKVWISNNA